MPVAQPAWTKPGPWALWAVVGMITAIAVVWVVTVERTQFEYDATIRDAGKQNSNLAIAIEEHTVRSLTAVEEALTLMSRAYLRDGPRLDAEGLFDVGSAPGAMVVNFGVIDDRRRVVWSVLPATVDSLGDGRFFLEHRERPGLDMRIPPPAISRESNDWIMVMSKRISTSDGSFGGVAFVTVNPRYFTRFYRQADLGREGRITLAGLDGIVRARRTGDTERFGGDMRSSAVLAEQKRHPVWTFTGFGEDGVERIYSYRTLPGYPMVVSVGTSRKEVLAEFYDRRRNYYAGAATATTLILIATAAIVHFQRRQRHAMADLRQSEQRFRQLSESIEQVFWMATPDLQAVTYVSPAFERLTGRSCEEFVSDWRIWAQSIHEDDRQIVAAAHAQLTEGRPYDIEYRFRHVDGKEVWVNDRGYPLRDATGILIQATGVSADITNRKQAEQQLRLSAQAFESIADGIIVTDAGRRIVSVNKSYSSITGYEPADLIGRTPQVFQSGRHDAAFYEEMWRQINTYGYWRGELWSRRSNGQVFPEMLSISVVKDRAGTTTHYVGVCTDISEVKRYEAELEHQARHDALTGLPNRFLFEDRFSSALTRAHRNDSKTAVLFIDLDHFKDVNDSLGHSAGDTLLQEWTTRLSALVRRSDTVARFGGDEFAVLLETITHTDTETIARKVLEAVALPFHVSGHDLFVSASIDISLYPDDGPDAATLLKNADTALYQAKTDGRNLFRFFSSDMHERALENLVMTNALRVGLERDELEVRYQPCVELASGRFKSVEALVSWRHPELGLLPPGRFIPLAEETGLIQPLGERVLEIACRQMRQWQDDHLPISRIAVNLSARQFRLPDLPYRIAAVLAATGLKGEHLELEVTESVMMQNPEAATALLMHLKSMGIQIAIDDFGTGYSSLSYLKSLPIDFLKIDKSFVSGVPIAGDDVAIIRAIIAMAKSLGLRLIAEGVETEDQRAFLASQGCDEAQGWLFSRPLPGLEITALLAARQADHSGRVPRALL